MNKMELIALTVVNHILSLEMTSICLFTNGWWTYVKNHRIIKSSVIGALAGYLIYPDYFRNPRSPFYSMHYAII